MSSSYLMRLGKAVCALLALLWAGFGCATSAESRAGRAAQRHTAANNLATAESHETGWTLALPGDAL